MEDLRAAKAKLAGEVIAKMHGLNVPEWCVNELIDNLETITTGNLNYMMGFSTAEQFIKILGA